MIENIIKTDKCTNCPLWKTSETSNGLYSCNKLEGIGNKFTSIMIVDFYPKEEEIKQKKSFVGIEAQLLKKYLQIVGLNDYYCTYLTKCYSGFSRTPIATEINECGKYLIEEINQIKPKTIILLGGGVLPFFGIEGKITKIRGTPIWSEKFNCYLLPTYSPSYLNNFIDQSVQRREFCEDLNKALKIVNEGISQKLKVNYKYASTIQEVEQFTKELLQSEWFSVDIETDNLDYFRGKILLTSYSFQPGSGYVIPYLHPKGFNEKGQKEVKFYLDKLLGSEVKKIIQNGKYDLQMMFTANIPIKKFAFDTMLAHHLLDENGLHSLNKMVPIYTDMGNYKSEIVPYFEGKIKILKEEVIQENDKYFIIENGQKIRIYINKAFRPSTIYDCPYEQLLKYSAQDADATFRLFKIFWSLLEQENLLKLLIKVCVPLSYVLAKMEYEGISGNIEYTKRMIEKLYNEISLAETNILTSKQIEEFLKKYQVPNNKFNVNSSDQKAKLFFDIMKLKPIKYNRVTSLQKEQGIKQGNPSTDAESLELLKQKNKIKILEDFITISKLKKSKEYLEEYANLISTSFDGRIHTSFNQIGTVTGRLSSNRPNVHNIPQHDPEKAKLIRTVFISKPGYTLVEADYSQIEFRCWGHISEDENLLRYLNNPLTDIHTEVAAQAFRIPKEQITKTLRDIAKQTVYGMIYGQSTYSIAKKYGMDEEEVNRFYNGFFRAFPKATKFLEESMTLMEKQGYIINAFGRRRRILDIYSKNKKLREAAQRQCRNFPLQSSAADLIFIAMIKLYKALLSYNVKMLIQIHDSLIFEVKDEQLNTTIPIIKNIMENAVKLKCLTPVEIETGKNLGNMNEYKQIL